MKNEMTLATRVHGKLL